jgi:hypothetical protein
MFTKAEWELIRAEVRRFYDRHGLVWKSKNDETAFLQGFSVGLRTNITQIKEREQARRRLEKEGRNGD